MKWENAVHHKEAGNNNARIIRDEEVVCRCMGTTAGEIRQCVRSGAITPEAILEKTGVGSACGFCRKKVQRVIDEAITSGAE